MTMNEANAILKLYNLRLRKRKNGMYWIRQLGNKDWQPIGLMSFTDSEIANQAAVEHVLKHLRTS